MKITLLVALTAIALPVAGFAQDATITVADGYARSANPKSGAAFMTLQNTGAADCTLTAVTTETAELAELHSFDVADIAQRVLARLDRMMGRRSASAGLDSD